MNAFIVLLRKELREAWRTNTLVIVAGVLLFFGLISPLAAKYTPDLIKQLGTGSTGGMQITMPTPKASDAIVQFLKNVGGNGIFVTLLLTMGVIAREKERGTAAFVLTKPVTRLAFLGAKLASLGIILIVGMILAGVATYWYTMLLFNPLPVGGFVAMCALVWLMLFAYTAVTFLGSAVAPKIVPAAGIGIAAIVVIAILAAIPALLPWTPQGLNEPAQAVALGEMPKYIWRPVLVSIGIVIATFAGSWFALRQQEYAQAEE
jgi:ABC-2 type transport system permease protein